MVFQNDYILRLIEEFGAVLREALRRFRAGDPPKESVEDIDKAIGLAVDMDPQLFMNLTPRSMVSFLELSNLDDRLTRQLAEALLLQADMLEAQGQPAKATTKREQAAAILASLERTVAG
jgi:hypothetical protein